MNNSLTRNNGSVAKKQTFSAFITSDLMKEKIMSMVGGERGQSFITSIISAVSNNPALQECESSTIVSAALLGESLKLSPSAVMGQYYFVPFNDRNRGCKVAQFQLGYKGYIQLAIRSGAYKKLNVLAIKKGELVKYDALNEEIEVNLIEDEEEREKTETIGYYAMFEYNNGFRKTLYWSKKKMEVHAEKYSMGFKAHKGYTFWEKDFDGMAYKTMLRQLISKWGIMSVEMEKAFVNDMAVIRDDKPEYVVDTTMYDNDLSAPIVKEEKVDETKTEVVAKPKEEKPKEEAKPKKVEPKNDNSINNEQDLFNAFNGDF